MCQDEDSIRSSFINWQIQISCEGQGDSWGLSGIGMTLLSNNSLWGSTYGHVSKLVFGTSMIGWSDESNNILRWYNVLLNLNLLFSGWQHLGVEGGALQLNWWTHDGHKRVWPSSDYRKYWSRDTQGPYRNSNVGYVAVTKLLKPRKNAYVCHITCIYWSLFVTCSTFWL